MPKKDPYNYRGHYESGTSSDTAWMETYNRRREPKHLGGQYGERDKDASQAADEVYRESARGALSNAKHYVNGKEVKK